jgi:hypothetical protein
VKYLDTATYGYAKASDGLAGLVIDGKFGDITGTSVTLPNGEDSVVFIAAAASEVEGGEEPSEDEYFDTMFRPPWQRQEAMLLHAFFF